MEAGTAERDGTELALGRFYSFKGIMSKISTVEGCILTVEGECDSDHVAEGAQVTLDSTFQLNLDTLLRNLRRDAYHGNDSAREVADHVGPRIMIVGPSNVGKTTLARTLTARATKCRDEPQVVNLDPAEGLLSLPGTLTAATFATLMDVESMSGWGGTPTSGPSTVPVKLPIVYYYGRQHATDDPQLYKEVVSKLAGAVTERLNNHYLAKTAGLIIDTPAVDLEGKLGDLEMDLLAHVVDEFSVNMIVAMGVKELERLKKRFHGQETSVSDTTAVISVGKSQGGAEKDEAWLLACQQATIKEYFFGDSKMTLNPSTQLVDIESVTIYRIPEREFPFSIPFVARQGPLMPVNSRRHPGRAAWLREGRPESRPLPLDYARHERQNWRLPRGRPYRHCQGLRLHCRRQQRSPQGQYPCPNQWS